MFEAQLRDLLASQISVLEDGLVVLNTEQYIPSIIGTRSFIDILAKDKRGRWVLIELKRSTAASRQAIHEIYKYVETVKGHLGARDDEIRTIIVSTEWQELLVPFSRFVHDTSISIIGIKISVLEPEKTILAESVRPLQLESGRVLSPWHEISLYVNEERLEKGILSYDTSCRAKGINDYIMVKLKAPEGFYESSVLATAAALHKIRGGGGGITEKEITNLAQKMDRIDHMIYFVPQLQNADEYLEIIRADPVLFEEVKEFIVDMKGDELLGTLQEYALYAPPLIDRDRYEIGYPAKFQKIVHDEGWIIEKIHRRGAFLRNTILTDATILGEIEGDVGTSGKRLKRTINLSDKAEFTQLLKNVDHALPYNRVWADMIAAQLKEAQKDFSDGTVEITMFAPSTGVMTLFFAMTQEQGLFYVPSYMIAIYDDEDICRLYIGELIADGDDVQSPEAFSDILNKYYNGNLCMLLLSMTWGGYETRDVDILEDIGLIYSSFRCDVNENQREFFRMKNNRWRSVNPINFNAEFNEYLKNNERIVHIIVNKLLPRFSSGMWDGGNSDQLLARKVDPITIAQCKYHLDVPQDCDICSTPISLETFFSDGIIKGSSVWANMCADCSVYHGAGIGWGIGQLYRKEKDGRWLMVGGSSDSECDEII